jgi:radical SAM protein with 4Fe4S-binding SPASM domain
MTPATLRRRTSTSRAASRSGSTYEKVGRGRTDRARFVRLLRLGEPPVDDRLHHDAAVLFAAIDARGSVALCDCWVTSYPEHRFGNVFRTTCLSEMLGASPARQAFIDRPRHLVDHEDCGTCPHLSLCHGGCPVRTFAATGTILAKDPYCEVYKALFTRCRERATTTVGRRLPKPGPSRSESSVQCSLGP